MTWMLLLTTVLKEFPLLLLIHSWVQPCVGNGGGDLIFQPFFLWLYILLILEPVHLPDLSVNEPLISLWGQQWRLKWAGVSSLRDIPIVYSLPALPPPQTSFSLFQDIEIAGENFPSSVSSTKTCECATWTGDLIPHWTQDLVLV